MHATSLCLWFDGTAEEAANFYIETFGNGRIISVMRQSATGPAPEGSVLSVAFEIDGRDYLALNGGPVYSFTPAISFYVSCDTQAEVDHFWDRLTDGGAPARCGWLTDRFGVSWQIVPSILSELLQSGDRAKAAGAMKAMLGMIKLDIAALQRGYDEA